MENNIISKELLSKVLGKNITDLEVCLTSTSRLLITTIPNSIVYTTDDSEYAKWINIYELANKCKSYTVKQTGWTLQSYTNERGSGICRIKVGDGQELNKLIAPSEPESIFKACEWVLNAK